MCFKSSELQTSQENKSRYRLQQQFAALTDRECTVECLNPGSSKDTNATETTNYRFRNMSSFSELNTLFLQRIQGEEK